MRRLILLVLLSCGGYSEPVIRKRPPDGGISTLFTEIEKINALCKRWETGMYVSPTGLKSYEWCAEW